MLCSASVSSGQHAGIVSAFPFLSHRMRLTELSEQHRFLHLMFHL
jgi:hypothetical protein